MQPTMNSSSCLDKSKLPYSLLLDPQTQRAAAYTNTHLTITEEASKTLLDYAKAHTAKSAPFDAREHAAGMPNRRPLPAWATPEVQERLVLIWIKRPHGDAPEEEWQAIPPR